MRIVVGGAGRKSGKTTLACRILSLAHERRWTAVKISHHAPESGAPYELLAEHEPGPVGDTRRYLAAGAARAFWLRGDSERALPELRALLDASDNWIVESTRAIAWLEADAVLIAGSGPPPSDDELRALLRAGGQPDRKRQPAR